MKTITTVVWLAATVTLWSADSPVPASTNAPAMEPLSGPPGTVLGVMRGTDKRTLAMRYAFAGKTNEQSIILTNEIADFHFCSWYLDRGVAFALSDTSGDVYWAAAYFARLAKPIYPRKIRSPAGNYKLIGVANTVGDTIAITAMDLRGDSEVVARGWLYVNRCPPAWDIFVRAPTNAPVAQIQMSGFDHLTEFEVPKIKVETKK